MISATQGLDILSDFLVYLSDILCVPSWFNIFFNAKAHKVCHKGTQRGKQIGLLLRRPC